MIYRHGDGLELHLLGAVFTLGCTYLTGDSPLWAIGGWAYPIYKACQSPLAGIIMGTL